EVKYQISLYLIVLVVFFGFDEMITVLTNPLLFILCLIIGGFGFTAYKLGLGGVVTSYMTKMLTMSVASMFEYLRGFALCKPLIDIVWPVDVPEQNKEDTNQVESQTQ
ncbi:GTP-binding protein, putative, partial [Entamoeba invadens IP1]